MTATIGGTRRITVVFGDTRADLVAPEHLALSDLVVSGGFAPDAVVADAAGRVFDPRTTLGESFVDGAVLYLVSSSSDRVGAPTAPRTAPVDAPGVAPTSGSAGSRHADIAVPPGGSHRAGETSTGTGRQDSPGTRTSTGPRPDTRAARTVAVPVDVASATAGLVAALALFVLAVVQFVAWSHSRVSGPSVSGGGPAVAVAALAFVAGLGASVRPGTSRGDRLWRLAGPLLGASAALTAVRVADGTAGVAVVAALVVAAVFAATGRVACGSRDPVPGILAAVCAGLAALATVGVVFSWPGWVFATIAAGAAPVALRLLPGLSIDVPAEQLVDAGRLSPTAWSPRQEPRRRRRLLKPSDVETLTGAATTTYVAGVVLASVVAVIGVAVGVGLAPRSGLPGWGVVALASCLVVALALTARTVRDRQPKTVLRLAAGALTVLLLLALRDRGVATGAVAAAAAVVCAVTIALTRPLAAGWRSLGASRFADLVEGVAVVFSLPCALLAVDVVETLRRLTSG